jgi:tetratricopeptide (TPR) repeat protein
MEIKLKKIASVLMLLLIAFISGCATNGMSSGQLLPDESRATPELALLNEKAQLADAGGEAAKAEALYKAVLRNTPNDADTWYRLGNLYANYNRPAEAAIAYERTLVADNGHARAWHNLAIIRLRQSYAALLQAQITVPDDDPILERIDSTLDQLSKLTALDNQPRPAITKRPALPSATQGEPSPATGPNAEVPYKGLK